MYPKSFKKLIDHFSSLPSVGPKMAERLVLFLFKQENDKLESFSESLRELKSSLRQCVQCGNISEQELCYICLDRSRDHSVICVVEDPIDIISIEKTKKYNGLYHVLGGLLGPVQKTENTSLKINELEERVKKENIQEIIIATDPTTEGDATAFYLMRLLKDYSLKITRLARGLSTGSDIEHADELTLGSAILNRK